MLSEGLVQLLSFAWDAVLGAQDAGEPTFSVLAKLPLRYVSVSKFFASGNEEIQTFLAGLLYSTIFYFVG